MEIGINELEKILEKHYGQRIYIKGYYTGNLYTKQFNDIYLGDVFGIEVDL
jgi:hypothetical protein